MTKIVGKGCELQLDVSTVYTTIASVNNISGPTAEYGTTDATTLDSTAREKLKTIFDGGQVTFECVGDPAAANFQLLTDVLKTTTIDNWKLVFSDAASTEWPFTGYCTKVEPSGINVDGHVVFNSTIEVSGDITYPT
jgi:hypothetical protein